MGEAEGQGRTTVLNEEVHSIHYANRLFWSEQSHNREARIEHYLRQDRLEEIRSELGGLVGFLGFHAGVVVPVLRVTS